jgi:Uma2 family endonuclease
MAHPSLVIPDNLLPGVAIRLPMPVRQGPDWFLHFCEANRDWQFEQTAEGDVLIMAPNVAEGGFREASLISQLFDWAQRNGSGKAFGSSTGFFLPNEATRAPDASWVPKSRLRKLTPKQRRSFPPLCPDFVAEIRSMSDRLPVLKAKMEEYRSNGARLGWLIDPFQRTVHIYRPGKPVEVLKNPRRITGDPELPGFVLKLGQIWKTL